MKIEFQIRYSWSLIDFHGSPIHDGQISVN